MTIAAFIATAVIAFFLGSIPFGIIIGKFVFKTDIRKVGSGNIGTTNAIRALGFKGGALVFLLDFSKGLLAGFIALGICKILGLEDADTSNLLNKAAFLNLAFFMCSIGHIFSPWLDFKGGKGIAVAVGCLFVSYGPIWAILELTLFGVLVATTRYVSLGSIAAAALCSIATPFLFPGNPLAIVFGTLTGLIILWAHRENIKRLASGTENKFGSKDKS